MVPGVRSPIRRTSSVRHPRCLVWRCTSTTRESVSTGAVDRARSRASANASRCCSKRSPPPPVAIGLGVFLPVRAHPPSNPSAQWLGYLTYIPSGPVIVSSSVARSVNMKLSNYVKQSRGTRPSALSAQVHTSGALPSGPGQPSVAMRSVPRLPWQEQIAVALLRPLEAESPAAAVRHDSLLYYCSRRNAEVDLVSPYFRQVCVESKFTDREWGRAF